VTEPAKKKRLRWAAWLRLPGRRWRVVGEGRTRLAVACSLAEALAKLGVGRVVSAAIVRHGQLPLRRRRTKGG